MPMPRSAPGSHSAFDDAQALVTGSLFVVAGIATFSAAGLLTGGTAGLAFLACCATGVPFGAAFFAINLPFYALAVRATGRPFTLKTSAAIGLVSAAT